MSLPGRWSRHVLLVVAAAVVLGLATLVGGIGSTQVPGDVRRAFETAIAERQAASVAPLDAGVDQVDYTSFRGTGSAADVEATQRLWTDDGSGRAGETTTVTATLRRGEDGWQVSDLADSGPDAQ